MNLKDRKRANIITCPHCGREYLPVEIFIPNNFFGKPEDIDRTEDGRIEDYNGSAMDLTETYTCDNCGTEFNVETTLKFKVQENIKPVFEEVYSSPLFKSKISLFEDNLIEAAQE